MVFSKCGQSVGDVHGVHSLWCVIISNWTVCPLNCSPCRLWTGNRMKPSSMRVALSLLTFGRCNLLALNQWRALEDIMEILWKLGCGPLKSCNRGNACAWTGCLQLIVRSKWQKKKPTHAYCFFPSRWRPIPWLFPWRIRPIVGVINLSKTNPPIPLWQRQSRVLVATSPFQWWYFFF